MSAKQPPSRDGAVPRKDLGAHGVFDEGTAPISARYLGGILDHLGCQPIIVGGVEDHVHALHMLSRTASLAEVIKEMKRGSSTWLKTKLADFEWQAGYGAFSIGQSQVDDVCSYIARQEEHHRKISFQDEIRALLTRYKVEFDERYVWD